MRIATLLVMALLFTAGCAARSSGYRGSPLTNERERPGIRALNARTLIRVGFRRPRLEHRAHRGQVGLRALVAMNDHPSPALDAPHAMGSIERQVLRRKQIELEPSLHAGFGLSHVTPSPLACLNDAVIPPAARFPTCHAPPLWTLQVYTSIRRRANTYCAFHIGPATYTPESVRLAC